MLVTFEPRICKPGKNGEAPRFSGNVTMRMPNYDDRMGLVEDCGIDIGGSQDDDTSPQEIRKHNVKLLRFAAKQLPKFLQAVAIKRIDDGLEFKSLEDLNYDGDMANVITEMSMRLVGKFRVETGSSPS